MSTQNQLKMLEKDLIVKDGSLADAKAQLITMQQQAHSQPMHSGKAASMSKNEDAESSRLQEAAKQELI
jgi:hypothetical protein